MDILESLRLGAEVYGGISQIHKQKQLFQDYCFKESKTQGPRTHVYFDIESNKQFLIAPCLNKFRFSILQRDFNGIRKISEVGTGLVQKAAWVAWDASLCFSLEQSKVKLWDSNSGKTISVFESMKFINFEPAVKEKELIVLAGAQDSLLVDFISGEVAEKGFQASGTIKWSPYCENYFLSGESQKCLLWDVRRLRSPVFSLGFSQNQVPYKRSKQENMINAYDSMFFRSQQNSFQDTLLDFSFGIDGRWVFVKTQSGIFRINLTCVENQPELIVAENGSGFVLETELGLVSSRPDGLTRYGEYFDAVQLIQCPTVKMFEVPDEEVWYLIDSYCEIRRLSV